MRQMTFDIPESIADEFTKDVPEAERSPVVASLLQFRRPRRRRSEAEWEAACDAANADPAVVELEREWDSLAGDGLEKEPNDW